MTAHESEPGATSILRAVCEAFATMMDGGDTARFLSYLAPDAVYVSKHYRASTREGVVELLMHWRKPEPGFHRVGRLHVVHQGRVEDCVYTRETRGEIGTITTFKFRDGQVVQLFVDSAFGWYRRKGDDIYPKKMKPVRASDLQGKSPLQEMRRRLVRVFKVDLDDK